MRILDLLTAEKYKNQYDYELYYLILLTESTK